ncbi:MAG: SDR family NAD(P)-dependent oxidoreductase, partial [Cyanobacteria bacterium P01_A01_bin.135]
CAELLAGEGIALLDLLNQGGEEINQTAIAQPLLFAVEYALAQLWQSWGVRPEALIGHSLGEYVAACLAGVFSLEDGLRLVALRGRLMQQCPAGAMLSVGLSEGQLAPLLPEGVVIAAVNGPALCAVSGTEAAIAALAADLEAKDIPHQRLQTSHGFHSPLMEPMLEPFRVALQQVPLQPPQIPMVSNVTGTWLTAEAATDPDYWVRQARQPVRFMAGLETLSSLSPVLLEVGPGTVLARLATQTLKDAKAIASLPHPKSATPEWTHLLEAVGQLWQRGVPLDWQQLHLTPRRRVPLPTYPFERQRYWVEPDEGLASGIQIETKPALASDLANWFYQPTWQRSLPSTASVLTEPNCWLVLTEGGLGAQLAQRLEQAGQDVIRVARGEAFAQTGYRQFALNPQRLEDYAALMKDLRLRELVPTQVVSLWGLQADDLAAYRQATEVQYLVNAITAQPDQDCQISLVTTGLYDVVGEAVQQPMRGAIAGLSLVIGQEYPSLGCRLIELEDTEAVEPLWRTLIAPPTAIVIACRRSHLWQQTYQPLPLPEAAATRLQRGGTYLIAGNLSQGMGHIWAEHLAAQWQAKLVLLGDRSTPTLPKEAEGIALSLDLTDPAQLSAALQQAEAELGPIRGLFYSAPTTNDQSAAPLALMQPSHWDYNLRHKLQGLLSLQVALAEKPLDFCLVQSSLSAVIGGVGLGAYAAANSAMDAIIQQQNQQSGTPWFSVNWDACLTEEVQAGFGSANAAFALTSEEVWAATERILEAAPPGQIVVSKGGLTTRIRQWVQAAPRPQADEPTATHARPQIATPYAPPRSDIEQTVAAIWQDLLGVEQVGIHDSFFDLGGHSLLAIQVVSRLREAFPVAIEMRSLLFEAPTVAGIAAAIAPHLPDEEEMDEMAALLAEVQGLSSEEVQQQLAQSQGGAQ